MLWMVRLVDVMVLLMPMVLQVLYRVMCGVTALLVVLLRLGGGVARDSVGGEATVIDAPAVAVAEVALLVVLSLMVLLLVPVVSACRVMLPFTVSLVMMMMRVLHVALVWVRVWAVLGLCLGAGRLCSRLGPDWRQCWPVLLVALTVRMRHR